MNHLHSRGPDALKLPHTESNLTFKQVTQYARHFKNTLSSVYKGNSLSKLKGYAVQSDISKIISLHGCLLKLQQAILRCHLLNKQLWIVNFGRLNKAEAVKSLLTCSFAFIAINLINISIKKRGCVQICIEVHQKTLFKSVLDRNGPS